MVEVNSQILTYGLYGDPVKRNAQPRVSVEVDDGLLDSLLRWFQFGHRESLEVLKAGGARLQWQLGDGVQSHPAIAVGPEEGGSVS